MKISFVKDPPCQYVSVDAYLADQNPVTLPIGSSNAALLTSMTTELTTLYGAKVSLSSDTTNTVVADFDRLFLSPIKKAQPKLKGGLFFLPSAASGGNTIYEYYSLVVTKSPTSAFFLPSLAA